MEPVSQPASSGAIVAVAVSNDPDGAAVVEISGELDISSVPVVRQAVDNLMGGQGASDPDGAGDGPGIVFDLSRLEFVDSSGISFFLETVNRAGSVHLRHPQPRVRRVLEVTGLLHVLQVGEQ